MVYRCAAWLHSAGYTTWNRLRDQRGQGTVEYVGMTVVVTLLVAAIATAAGQGWAGDIGGALKGAISKAIKAAMDPLSG